MTVVGQAGANLFREFAPDLKRLPPQVDLTLAGPRPPGQSEPSASFSNACVIKITLVRAADPRDRL